MKKLLKFITGITAWQVEEREKKKRKENSTNFMCPNLTNFHSI
jgi:hypothetical protein